MFIINKLHLLNYSRKRYALTKVTQKFFNCALLKKIKDSF